MAKDIEDFECVAGKLKSLLLVRVLPLLRGREGREEEGTYASEYRGASYMKIVTPVYMSRMPLGFPSSILRAPLYSTVDPQLSEHL